MNFCLITLIFDCGTVPIQLQNSQCPLKTLTLTTLLHIFRIHVEIEDIEHADVCEILKL